MEACKKDGDRSKYLSQETSRRETSRKLLAGLPLIPCWYVSFAQQVYQPVSFFWYKSNAFKETREVVICDRFSYSLSIIKATQKTGILSTDLGCGFHDSLFLTPFYPALVFPIRAKIYPLFELWLNH